MKCPKCGSENPDHGYYCGSCAAELRGGSQAEPGKGDSLRTETRTKIENILQRNLVRVSENIAKKQKRHGLFGRFGGASWRSGTIAFKSEFEEVTLSYGEEGHISVKRGIPAKFDVMLEGPHESFLMMFHDEHHVTDIPESIGVRMMVSVPFHDEATQQILRNAASKLLRDIFE